MRISKVTTKTGDGGKTSLGDGKKVSKSSLRIKCLGAVDELNSFIGFAKVASEDSELKSNFLTIQNHLLNLGGEISSPSTKLDLVNEDSIDYIEKLVDNYNSQLEPLKEFIIPGDDEFSARVHLARSVCRRAETNLVELGEEENIKQVWIKYLNRLSDLFFIIGRYHLKQSDVTEKQWNRS